MNGPDLSLPDGAAAPDPPLATILIVDDEPSVRSAINDYLTQSGYRVLEAGDGPAMRQQLDRHDVDVVLLDVMLPGESGLVLAKSLADHADLGVIMISALGGEADRIAGLEIGADDYLPKPVSPRELLARIQALRRRFKRPASPIGVQFEFAGWRLDPVRRILRDPQGVVTSISEGEFGLLLAFVENPRRAIGREELLGLARGGGSDAFDRAIDTQVSRLRQKLRTSAGGEIIRTLRGEGYMIMPGVTLASSATTGRDDVPATPADSDLRIDTAACEIRIGGQTLDLTFSEYSLLAILMEQPGTVTRKDALSRRVLGRPWRTFDRSIDVHVSNLRNKLSAYPGTAIETVRKVGYRLVFG